jgi:hypothetical protein
MRRFSAELLAKMRRDDCPLNVRLFLARVVANRAAAFAPFAADWLEPLLYLSLRSDAFGSGLHVLLRELCITLLGWGVAPPPALGRTAGQFVAHLMERAAHERPSIVRQNLDVVKLFVERWRTVLVPQRGPACKFLREERSAARLIGVQLLGILVANGFAAFDPADATCAAEPAFFEALVRQYRALLCFAYV